MEFVLCSCGFAQDPRHVLNIPTFHDDMILAKSHESHVIATSLFRLSRLKGNFEFGKDNMIVPICIKFSQLLFFLHNIACLQRIGNTIRKFIKSDESTRTLGNGMNARLSVVLDVSKTLAKAMNLDGEAKDSGFWQHIECEGYNNAFYTKCD